MLRGLLMLFCPNCKCCRGYDPVAPAIHEWTYEAMAYDLLDIQRSTFK